MVDGATVLVPGYTEHCAVRALNSATVHVTGEAGSHAGRALGGTTISCGMP